jgi:TatD DNase family protein
MLIDSHCHLNRLDLSPYDGQLETALAKAKAKGVNTMLSVCVDLDEFSTIHQIATSHAQIYASVGLHPTEKPGIAVDQQRLTTLAKYDKVIAIGETGLDYFHCEGDLQWQKQRFIDHLAVAKTTKKPVIVHTRNAIEDTINILEANSAGVQGVMHCFTESWEWAKRALDIGFYISISGIVTFKNAHVIHELAQKVPLDRLLIETDSPYLAPVPYRGKSNEPAYVYYVAQQIAHLRETSLEVIGQKTSENFHRLFALCPSPE